MKQITSNTVLIQGDKCYPAIKTKQGIVWVNKDAEIKTDNWYLAYDNTLCRRYASKNVERDRKIIAANFELEGVPKIELEDEIMSLARKSAVDNNYDVGDDTYKHGFVMGHEANQAKYTEKDMANFGQWIIRQYTIYTNRDENFAERMLPEYIQSINSIKEITVDENFKQI